MGEYYSVYSIEILDWANSLGLDNALLVTAAVMWQVPPLQLSLFKVCDLFQSILKNFFKIDMFIIWYFQYWFVLEMDIELMMPK